MHPIQPEPFCCSAQTPRTRTGIMINMAMRDIPRTGIMINMAMRDILKHSS
jgi:hypothetical protein